MERKEKVLESVVTVRFQDCDPFGHLNNARYIDYFMDARQEQIARHYGILFIDRDRNESWVISLSQIAFLRPVEALETIRVRTQLINATDSTLTVEGAIFSSKSMRLKALAWVDFIYVGMESGRRAQHPRELMELFETVRVDGVHDPHGFVRRASDIRSVISQLG